MTANVPKDAVWLITGCSTGIGRSIAQAALAAGYRAVVTARDPAKVADIVTAHPGRAISAPLDVTRKEQIAAAIEAGETAFGSIDVLVNNAAYGYLAAVEEGEDHEVRALFDTNYFGAVDCIKAVLPGMRARGFGHVINISSMTGLVANPANAYYSSTKFALEALTEALSKEVAAFGIKVTAVEPGAFRTDWSGRSARQTGAPIAAYEDSVGLRRRMIIAADGKQEGDPDRAAEEIVKIALTEKPPLHLLLGPDVYRAYTAKLDGLQAEVKAWEAVSLSTSYKN